MRLFNIAKRLIPALVLVSVFLLSACTAEQQKLLEGVLQNVDTVNGTITVVDKDGNTQVITIKSDSQIQTQSGSSSIDALETGTKVKIELETEGVARRIDADLARVRGTISQANAASGSITVIPERGGTAVTVSVPADTRIRISGDRSGTFSNLTVGAGVDVRYNPDTKVAMRVSVGENETAEIEGNITTVSGSKISIQAEKRSLTLTVDNTTLIRSKGNTVPLSDLKSGVKVNARFDPFTMIATRIEVQGNEGENGDNRGEGKEDEDSFKALLSGDQEVPAVITTAQGDATFKLSDNGSELSFRLNINNTDNVQMAHIHLAAKGANGPVVVWLYPSAPPAVLKPGRFDGVLATGTITAANLTGQLQGQPLSALIDQIKAGTAYVNVHTVKNPGGEIRGQILPGGGNGEDEDDDEDEREGKNGGGNEEGPPAIPHTLEGRSDCLVCHQTGVAGAPRVPADHSGRPNAVCQGCHKPG
jgi:hypothetical protein